MANSRTKKSAKNTLSGLIFRIVGLLAPFAVRTVMIKVLGIDYLGLNSLFSSILQVLSLAELGFSTSIAFSMYKPVEENDVPTICKYLQLLRKTYYIIGSIILVVGAAITPAVPYLINGSHPDTVNIYIIYIVYLFNTAISYFMWSYKSVLFVAGQRSDIENNIQTIGILFMYGAQIVALLAFPNYYLYIAFMPASTLLINVIRAIYAKKKYPEYFAKGELEKEEKKKVFKNIGALFGHRLSGTVVSSTDSIFISAFLGLAPLALYQNYFFIISALISLISVFHISITASIGNSIIYDPVDKNYSDFKSLTLANVWITGWMAITFIVLAQHFMSIWVGTDYQLELLIPILLGLYFYLWKFKDILCVYKDAAGMWKQDLIKPYVVSIVNVLLDLLLVYYMGVSGVIIATIVSVFIISFPWETHVFFKEYLKRSPKEYYLKLFIYTIIVAAAGTATWFACYYLPDTGIGFFIVKALICIALPNVIFLIAFFKTKEFGWLKNKALSLFKRDNSSNQNN